MSESAAVPGLQVLDNIGEEITSLWKAYHQLLTQVQWWGRSSPSPPIAAGPYDQRTQSITVQATQMEIVRSMAKLDVIATEVQSNTATAQVHTTTVEPQHVGKAPPP
eukprot:12919411-Prorocentrum_lima.AAC.1